MTVKRHSSVKMVRILARSGLNAIGKQPVSVDQDLLDLDSAVDYCFNKLEVQSDDQKAMNWLRLIIQAKQTKTVVRNGSLEERLSKIEEAMKTGA